jgi:hypothetical protein
LICWLPSLVVLIKVKKNKGKVNEMTPFLQEALPLGFSVAGENPIYDPQFKSVRL